ncbi:MAG: SusD/RagB family nutrient-binding outer membrane lipoprotein [Chitinophagaceae bacterium]|nr:SusD/RagB family nutrient-binding outer membrane lipoprotein [Chitinophagaceae bacterium]
MKKYIKLLLGSLVAVSIVTGSCAKKIDEVYANPNNLNKQPIEQIFPSLIGSITGSGSAAGSADGLAGDALLIGRYIQYWGTFSTTSSPSSLTVSNASNYDQMGGTVGTSDNLGSMWGAHYYGMGQNLNKVVTWGLEEQKWDFVGAATALRAWSLLETTNEYGDIILREAFDITKQQFHYEDQSEVYDSVRATCFRALDFLNRTGGGMNATSFANSDYYFNGGDLNRWKKFVYGILARSYAYISNKTSYSADSVIKYASLSCVTNGDNITCKFQGTAISATNNYFGNLRQNVNSSASGIRQSSYIANLMNGTSSAFGGVQDPRAWYIIRPNTNGTFKGITPWSGSSGLVAADQPESFMGTSYATAGYPFPELGRYIFRDVAEWPVMTASEMKFLIAEAYLRKADNVNSRLAYIDGIKLNFDHLKDKYSTNVPALNLLSDAVRDTYVANTGVVPASPSGMNLGKILLQKYIALYGWGVHITWSDMRRFHYIDQDPFNPGQQVYVGFTPPSGSNLHGTNTGKLVYRARPRYNSEYLYNIPALTAIGAYPTNNDYHTKETWFSKP